MLSRRKQPLTMNWRDIMAWPKWIPAYKKFAPYTTIALICGITIDPLFIFRGLTGGALVGGT